MEFLWKFIFWITLWASIIIADLLSPQIVYCRSFKVISFIIGIIFVSYGLLLNAIAGKTLKKYAHFEVKKGIHKSDKLIDIGIFSCMRHPAMFGGIFFSIGLALLGGKIMVILWSGWVSYAGLYFILAVEERETLNRFGYNYCDFLKNTKPFSFSLRCLWKGIKSLKS